jgi:hypothetical protein
LAQCDPRLIGLSQPGSWPTHTPFDTSAISVQPERQGADGGKAAGGETGAAQEGAAIETAARLLGHGGGKHAAARLAFCSLDQHGLASLISSRDSG